MMGIGTTFTILFPLSDAAAVEARATRGVTPADYSGSGTILIIDDEPLVLRTLRALLENLGHDVLEAPAGLPGIEIFKRDPSKIRGIVLDMTMPDLSGKEVFEQVRKISPTVPVIFSSGYSTASFGSREGLGPTAFLHKPYTFEGLVNCLVKVLEPNAAPVTAD
jgi:two-component system cell cycle sensor histidine kinase/response regulator CckA